MISIMNYVMLDYIVISVVISNMVYVTLHYNVIVIKMYIIT